MHPYADEVVPVSYTTPRDLVQRLAAFVHNATESLDVGMSIVCHRLGPLADTLNLSRSLFSGHKHMVALFPQTSERGN